MFRNENQGHYWKKNIPIDIGEEGEGVTKNKKIL